MSNLSFSAQFNIPLPFGGITVDKRPDGQTQVGLNQGINILGWGGSRGITFTGGNGSFSARPEGSILANGTNIGTNSTFGFDKEKGVALDTDLNLGDDTVHGGVGKESQFINDLSTVVDKKKKEKEAKINKN